MSLSDRTEDPTGKKLAKAREEGQVAKSVELNAAVTLLVSVLLLRGSGTRLLESLQILIIDTVTTLPSEINADWLRDTALKNILPLVPSLGLIVGGMLVTNILITGIQTKFLWASKNLKIDLNKLNFLNGFKRLVSSQSLIQLIKSTLKISLIGWIAYSFLRSKVPSLIELSHMEFMSALGYWAGLASQLVIRVGSAYLILAIIDYIYQRWQHKKSLKMTKQEVKDEHKQSEGDPKIKSRIRGKQMSFARMRMMANVPKADVIITNPTHLAIAIQYNPESMSAPRIIAKGAYRIAERIVELGRSNRIPVMQNVPLARALYNTVEVDEEIPSDLYVALAEVLAYVFKLRQSAFTPA